MAVAWAALGAGDLGLPAPPAELGPPRKLGERRWGTVDPPGLLRELGALRDDFEAGRALDGVVAGIEPVGADEAVHFHLVLGPIGLFVQARDPGTLAAAAEVQGLALRARDAGRLEAPGRLTVLHSDWGARAWAWTGDGATGEPLGLSGAAAWLDGRLG